MSTDTSGSSTSGGNSIGRLERAGSVRPNDSPAGSWHEPAGSCGTEAFTGSVCLCLIRLSDMRDEERRAALPSPPTHGRNGPKHRHLQDLVQLVGGPQCGVEEIEHECHRDTEHETQPARKADMENLDRADRRYRDLSLVEDRYVAPDVRLGD